jgi:hypothetical protein
MVREQVLVARLQHEREEAETRMRSLQVTLAAQDMSVAGK